MSAAQEIYTIHLPQFEGPFDLLLFFIERDELDIHDIPISKITNDFLEYIHQMESLNIEVASEFILMASTLMKIKARMLIPRPELNEQGEEIDPRAELVNRLLEYKRYKSVMEEMEQLEANSAQHLPRGFIQKEEKLILQSATDEDELVGLDLYTVMKTFKRLWERHQSQLARPKHVIQKYPYSLDAVKDNILSKLGPGMKVSFLHFALEVQDKVYVVFNFLAVLELAQAKQIKIIVGEGYNNFWISGQEAAED